jgi:hypothetical protein
LSWTLGCNRFPTPSTSTDGFWLLTSFKQGYTTYINGCLTHSFDTTTISLSGDTIVIGKCSNNNFKQFEYRAREGCIKLGDEVFPLGDPQYIWMGSGMNGSLIGYTWEITVSRHVWILGDSLFVKVQSETNYHSMNSDSSQGNISTSTLCYYRIEDSMEDWIASKNMCEMATFPAAGISSGFLDSAKKF